MGIDITRMTSKGQVVIPRDIRRDKRLRKGEKFVVYDMGENIILKRVDGLRKAKDIREFDSIFSSLWKAAKAKGITKADIASEIRAYREEHA
ncbi:AbrB/MazE/SpoVT family DNA-binding domain-containing protein [Candidatus Woesearchaeota archaeon]|nr:AbrB/MazE/SpoVT family DNA-binding domain-containing protein [Candidatus Woesearchaeota archaeon]